jgi:CRP-like cAMP-binding protein
MTWRATRLRTKMADYIILPNAMIAREPIINYSRPTRTHGYKLKLGVNYGVPPNKVRNVVLQALAGVDEVLKHPAPSVWLVEYSDFSINYDIKFYTDNFERLEHIESRVMDLIWYFFKREGIVIPFPIRDVNMRRVTVEDEARQMRAAAADHLERISAVDIFKPLSDEERARLAAHVREQIFAAGEMLVQQGDEGQTFYIITSGEVEVSVTQGKRQVVLTRLGEGEFFGEMTLLTGEQRNATVTARTDTEVLALSHTVLAPILKANEQLADDLAGVLARRQADQGQKLAEVAKDAAPQDAVSRTVLLDKISRFFGLGGEG